MSLEVLKPSISKNVALGLAQILLWGGSYFILSILVEPIMQETGWSYQMVYGCLSLSLLISGLLLPRIGKIIGENEKNFVLPYAGAIMALGLTIIGLSDHYLLFLAGWAIIGVAMGMGLYDALFASLGKSYGMATSKVIVQVTPIASLAPTISWFLVSLLLSNYGWRSSCFIYAAILLVTIFPIHRFALPLAAGNTGKQPPLNDNKAISHKPFRSKVYYLLLVNFTIGAVLTTGIIIHLIDILLDKGMAMATIVGAVAFLGPSQAGVRVLELLFSKNKPAKTAVISGVVTLLGILLLLLNPNFAILGIILFGMGNGMRSILRGTLPLAIFGQEQYAAVVGKLARMPLIAQALTPFIGSFLIAQYSATVFLFTCCLLALINIMLFLMVPKLMPQQNELRGSITVSVATKS
ncbi:MFS transporter [Rufibacter roseus]|uniref:MFS transporter n=1 Tax=Rufibacter roseus TaxID=1567108 RepID=A0ABW2DUL9_9BACT|nr:MFS transporter [Rufibacter roseus]